jgi:hypothetical protein
MFITMGGDEMIVDENRGYEFFVRGNVPKGYVENERFPELPAAILFLNQYDGEKFSSVQEFEKILSGFTTFLKVSHVPVGEDLLLRTGLYVRRIEGSPREIEGRLWDYTVETKADNGPGVCVFGGLEEKHLLG